MKKFIPADVFRNSSNYDCTNNGISARHNGLFIEHPEGWINECDAPEERRVTLNDYRGYLSVKPQVVKGHSMMGGNFLYSCDSRFRRAISDQPVAIHDRVE